MDNKFDKIKEATQAEWEDLAADLQDLLVDAEALTDSESGQKIKNKLKDSYKRVSKSARYAAVEAGDAAKKASYVVDDYAHDAPWNVAGFAFAAGALLGFLIAKR